MSEHIQTRAVNRAPDVDLDLHKRSVNFFEAVNRANNVHELAAALRAAGDDAGEYALPIMYASHRAGFGSEKFGENEDYGLCRGQKVEDMATYVVKYGADVARFLRHESDDMTTLGEGGYSKMVTLLPPLVQERLMEMGERYLG